MRPSFAEERDRFTSANYSIQRQSRLEGNLPQQTSRYRAESPKLHDALLLDPRTARSAYVTYDQRSRTDETSVRSGSYSIRKSAVEPHGAHQTHDMEKKSAVDLSRGMKDAYSKPLPQIPDSPSEKAPTEEVSRYGTSTTHHRTFSFVPGDDEESLPNKAKGKETTISGQETHNHGTETRDSTSPISKTPIDSAQGTRAWQPEPIARPEGRKSTQNVPTQTSVSRLHPGRNSSQSSTVTSVHDTSGQKTRYSESIDKNESERPKANCHSGSSNARIAALRAVEQKK
jgi:hypothetical protein